MILFWNVVVKQTILYIHNICLAVCARHLQKYLYSWCFKEYILQTNLLHPHIVTVTVPYQKIPVNNLKYYEFGVSNVCTPILIFIVDYYFTFFPINQFWCVLYQDACGGQMWVKIESGILQMVLKSCFLTNINKDKCTQCIKIKNLPHPCKCETQYIKKH